MLVLERNGDGPGLHALLIGIGGYPDLGQIGFGAPRHSVLALLDLLIRLKNLAVPLQTVQALFSGPPDPAFGEEAAHRPTADAIRLAVGQWRESVAAHADNIGFVYVAGLGLPEVRIAYDDFEATVLTDEVGPTSLTEYAFTLSNLLEALYQCRQQKHLHIFETHRLSARFLAGLDPKRPDYREPRKPLFSVSPRPPKQAASYPPSNSLSISLRTQAAVEPGYDPPSWIAPVLERLLTVSGGTTAHDLQVGLKAAIEGVSATLIEAQGLPFEPAKFIQFGGFALTIPSEGLAVEAAPLDVETTDTAGASAVGRSASDEAAAEHVDVAGPGPAEPLPNSAVPPPPPGKRARRTKARPEIANAQPDNFDTGSLEEALASYRAALEVYTRDQRPLEWARAQNNLGKALRALGEQKGEPAALEEAVLAYRAALEVYTRDRQPLEWARTHNDLGDALQSLSKQREDPDILEAAASAYRAALEVESPDQRSFERSTTESNLGNVQRALDQAPAGMRAPEQAATPPPQRAAVDEPVTEAGADEAATEFVLDDAEAEHDELGRSVLAIGLARRLHKIWRNTNRSSAAADDVRGAFVVHLDAPWGGGKTTFANFLARVLDPLSGGRGPAASFLTQRYPGADLGGIFLDDPPPGEAAAVALAALAPDERRPWVVVNFNAWQAEHCAPPWWVFYQAIRKGCFDAVLRGGAGAWRPRLPIPAHAPRHRRLARALVLGGERAASRLGGMARWLGLWAVEYAWRLFNPKIFSLLATAAVSLGLLTLLAGTGLWGIIEGERGTGVGYILGNPVGLLLTGLGGVTGLWALGALITESIVPGTDTLAERMSLGNGDPFSRFRRHFAHTMKRVRRPVMVVVDDLDRCRPDFVVDLVRGIQTLLRSPRVVFLILGDRDWIERAFEAHHEAMKTVDVGPEQSLGARFVEKAIQLSFILPALGEVGRLSYVRRVLLGERAAPLAKAAAKSQPGAAARAFGSPRPGALAEAETWLRETVNRVAATPGVGLFDAAPIVDLVREQARTPAFAAAGALLQEAVREHLDRLTASGELQQAVSETLAIRAASDDKVEREVTHELQRLAASFPANPRQIKRIVNAITIYYAVALQRPRVTPDAKFRSQLALWIIVMTEWPKTWRLLASFPGLVDLLAGEDPGKDAKPSGSAKAIAHALDAIRADGALTALITGIDESGQRTHARLETAVAAILAELTPLHSRKHRLVEVAGHGLEPAAEAKPVPRQPGPGVTKKRGAPASRKPRTK
jgi:tetratricopeptide (TPR) repeat protein